MVFDGLKKFFNRVGNFTVDSSHKVGEGAQKVSSGVQTPVKKVGKIKPRKPAVKSPFKSKKKDEDETLKFKASTTRPATPKRSIKRMNMDKDEIAIFRELIDKKYEKADTDISTEDSQKTAIKKASLEEILREEEKKGVDPKLILVLGALSFGVVFVVLLILGIGLEIGLIFGILIILLTIFLIYLPKMKSGGRSTAASREIPFALRQMATELRAGMGLHDSMRSVATSGYGPLSEEFARALEEIRYGQTTEQALMDMSERIDSEGLKRAVYQITRTLTSGGDLAKTLGVIAEDTAYEMRMKLKDYAQKLNSFTMIYMFIAILGPVILMVMLIAASTVMGPMIPPIMLLIMYLFFFPAIVLFMAFMIKRLEPKL
jgi:archaeal flagellar protein FlaJ